MYNKIAIEQRMIGRTNRHTVNIGKTHTHIQIHIIHPPSRPILCVQSIKNKSENAYLAKYSRQKNNKKFPRRKKKRLLPIGLIANMRKEIYINFGNFVAC